MRGWVKETGIVILGLVLAGCFVAGFASTFSFLGRAATSAGIIVLLVGADRLVKHENKMERKLEELERGNEVLQRKLEDATREIKYYREKERAGS